MLPLVGSELPPARLRLSRTSMEIETVQIPTPTLPMSPTDIINPIPTEFIRSETEQAATTTVKDSILEVPTIDMSTESSSSSLVEAIVKASSEWGIFQVINHGIPNEVISRMQQAGKEFFSLPQEEKMKYSKDEKELPVGSSSSATIKKSGVEGYGTNLQKGISLIPTDTIKPWNDHLFHRIWPPSCINYKFWPKNPSFYREANEVYCEYLRRVANKLFEYLSIGLGLKSTAMLEASGGDELEYMMKINYYPKCPRPDLVWGVPAHTDMSTLTILVPNEVPGLQVFRDEHWYEVKYIPNALVIHIGDQIEIMSNGKYKAVLHRTTVSKDKLRMSWPVFVEPPSQMEIGPLVDNTDVAGDDEKTLLKTKYKRKKYSDYVYCKLNKIAQ